MNFLNKIFLILVLLLFFSCNKSTSKINFLKKDKLYLFFRESTTKLGYIAQLYNINNKTYSHVGIGCFNKNRLIIISVLPNISESKNDNCLKIDSFESFFFPKNKEVIHGTVLEITESSKQLQKKLLKLVNNYRTRKIYFDTKIEGYTDSNYYCSEFVCEILSNLKIINCLKTKVKLTPFDKTILNKDSLNYYPVDMFFNDNSFIEISELNF